MSFLFFNTANHGGGPLTKSTFDLSKIFKAIAAPRVRPVR
jgi:hypothetical protein